MTVHYCWWVSIVSFHIAKCNSIFYRVGWLLGKNCLTKLLAQTNARSSMKSPCGVYMRSRTTCCKLVIHLWRKIVQPSQLVCLITFHLFSSDFYPTYLHSLNCRLRLLSHYINFL